MCYISRGLFHQNKFPVKLLGPNLFFFGLLVLYYLTDEFVFVLFMSSASYPHLLCRSSRSQMFFKIGIPKKIRKFYRKTQELSCEICKIFRNTFFYRTPLVAASTYFAFYECFFFYFSLAALPLFPYSAVTLFVWRNTFVFISLLLHHYYHNIRRVIRTTVTDTTYCTAISMIVILYFDGVYAETKKITYE